MFPAVSPLPDGSVRWAYSARQPRPTIEIEGPAVSLRPTGADAERTPPNVRHLFEAQAFLRAATRVVPGFAGLFTHVSLIDEDLTIRHNMYLFMFWMFFV